MRSLFEHLQGVRNEAPFGAWVRRIAVNRCFMHWRSPWQLGRAPSPAAPAGLRDTEDTVNSQIAGPAPYS